VYGTFDSYARYWAESLALPGVDHATLDAGIWIDGWSHITDGLEGGRGVILALPHLGGWEWAGFWLAEVARRPVSVVVERLEPPELFDWFLALRERLGMKVIPLGPGAGTAVVRALKANQIVCLLSDRDIDGGGVEVSFFGEKTTLPAGPATLALRTGAPLLPTAVYYADPGHRGNVLPPVPAERTGRLRDDVARVTQALASEMEALIRAAPDQWHLLQPNWPSDL
jgi:phosphatidylinositol dimannoside acyltransferase